MANDWFYKVGETACGPLTDGQLGVMIAQRRIGRDTPLRKGSAGRWVPARSLQHLRFPEETRPNAAPNIIVCACGKRVSIMKSHQGKSVKCPGCGQRLIVDLALRQIAAVEALSENSRSPRTHGRTLSVAALPLILLSIIIGLVGYLAILSDKRTHNSGDEIVAAAPRKERSRHNNPGQKAEAEAGEVNDPDDGERVSDGGIGQAAKIRKAQNKRESQRKQPPAGNAGKVEVDRVARGVGQLADLIEAAERCVVRLDVTREDGGGIGSGFVVDNCDQLPRSGACKVHAGAVH